MLDAFDPHGDPCDRKRGSKGSGQSRKGNDTMSSTINTQVPGAFVNAFTAASHNAYRRPSSAQAFEAQAHRSSPNTRLLGISPLPFAHKLGPSRQLITCQQPRQQRPLALPNSLRSAQSSSALQGSYWPDSDYPEKTINSPLKLTYQTLGKSAHPIFEVANTAHCPTFPDIDLPDVNAIDLTKLLTPGTVYLAFNPADVHLGEVTSDHALRKLDVASCPLATTRVSHTQGTDRTSLFLVPADLPRSARGALYDSVQKSVSDGKERGVSAITKILTDSGFALDTTETVSLRACTTPASLLQNLLSHGLSYNNERIPMRTINTSGQSLQTLKNNLANRPLNIGGEHLKALFDSNEAKAKRSQDAAQIRAGSPEQPASETPLHTEEDPRHPIEIAAARTSPMGAIVRQHISPHILFKVSLNPNTTARRLPKRLKPFDQKKPDWVTRLKKDVLFPPSTAKKVKNLMAESFDRPATITGPELLSLLQHQPTVHPVPDNTQPSALDATSEVSASSDRLNAQRFNCVITDSALILGQVAAAYPPADDVFSKHVLLAEYGDVRFAGEVYVHDETLFVTRNSGTYRPSDEQLNSTAALLSEQFPTISIQADHTQP